MADKIVKMTNQKNYEHRRSQENGIRIENLTNINTDDGSSSSISSAQNVRKKKKNCDAISSSAEYRTETVETV